MPKLTTEESTELAGWGAVPWADPDLVRSTYAARRAVSALLDAHVARCNENYSVEQCAEYVELIDWLHQAEELYACALDAIEPGSPEHQARQAYEEAEFRRGWDSLHDDGSACALAGLNLAGLF